MPVQECTLLVIPNVFPAKLWHLVNNPEIPAIVWDSEGNIIIIDKDLIEKQVLSPNNVTVTSCHTFKPINFSSFIRQLYAYGFKQAEYSPSVPPNIYRFFHPNFKKSNPELLSLLSRHAPKHRRKRQSTLSTKILPGERNEKKDVYVQCDNVEKNSHKGILSQQPVEPIPIKTSDFETTIQPQFPRRSKEADHYTGNYHKSLVPHPTPSRYSYLNTGISNMVYHPGQFVPAFCWYQWDRLAPGFFGFYQIGYPGNTIQVPSMYPIEPVSPFAQKMLCPPTCCPKSVVAPLNQSSAMSHLSISSDSNTSTIIVSSSPVSEVQANIKDTSTEQF